MTSWTLAAGLLGFTASAVFSALLHWQRDSFVLAYLLLILCLLVAYTQIVRPDWPTQFRRRWRSGLLGGVVLGALLVRSVLGQAGGSSTKSGVMLAIVWNGLVYGAVDAFLLNILPVLEVYRARAPVGRASAGQLLRLGATVLLSSLLVTASYHLGFEEFRGPALVQPLVGNALITAGYVLTGSPLTPLVGHVTMHVAAVLQGMETTSQLPPHY